MAGDTTCIRYSTFKTESDTRHTQHTTHAAQTATTATTADARRSTRQGARAGRRRRRERHEGAHGAARHPPPDPPPSPPPREKLLNFRPCQSFRNTGAVSPWAASEQVQNHQRSTACWSHSLRRRSNCWARGVTYGLHHTTLPGRLTSQNTPLALLRPAGASRVCLRGTVITICVRCVRCTRRVLGCACPSRSVLKVE